MSSKLRVIGGRAKGRRLRRVPGDVTRPIMDRVKESLFNIVGQDVIKSRWLDLFAGTGQVAIEALSRGARDAVLVENNRRALETIRWNLQHTGLSGVAAVIHGDAFAHLHHADPGPGFDFVFVAPPQYHQLWSRALRLLDDGAQRWLRQGAEVIVQIDPAEYEELELLHLLLADQRSYGRTQLNFYRQDEGSAPDH